MNSTSIKDLFDDIEEIIDEDDLFGLDDEKEENMTDQMAIRAKWLMDGAETLADAAEMLRAHADYLDSLHDAGYILRDPIEDDYGFAFLA